jgi:hypothetical protein
MFYWKSTIHEVFERVSFAQLFASTHCHICSAATASMVLDPYIVWILQCIVSRVFIRMNKVSRFCVESTKFQNYRTKIRLITICFKPGILESIDEVRRQERACIATYGIIKVLKSLMWCADGQSFESAYDAIRPHYSTLSDLFAECEHLILAHVAGDQLPHGGVAATRSLGTVADDVMHHLMQLDVIWFAYMMSQRTMLMNEYVAIRSGLDEVLAHLDLLLLLRMTCRAEANRIDISLIKLLKTSVSRSVANLEHSHVYLVEYFPDADAL